jgi:capsular exopolysaccharide synthesis family protein
LSLAKVYSNKLSANWAQPGAAVVNLEISGPVPQKEIDFLDHFIERYQNYDIEKKNKVATMAIGFLDEQLLFIADSLKLYEDQVEGFKRRNIITSINEETGRLYQKLQGLEDQKFAYQLKENYYKYITRQLENRSYDGIFTPSSVGVTDEIISTLITSLIGERTQVSLYTGPEKLLENPLLQDKLRTIEQLKENILKTIENNRNTESINIQFINDQITLVKEQLSKLPGTERELVNIQRNYELKEQLYVFLLQKRTEAGLSKASTTSDIVVVNPPMAAGAVTPKVQVNYLIGSASGLLLPVLIFVLIEAFNRKIQSKEDIEKLTNVPVIGGVGHNAGDSNLIVYNKPRSALAESFRALRSNLNYFTGSKTNQVFMITSSIPGEGKSFTTLNLASVFAMAGKRTVIIGADLRKPKLFEDFQLSNVHGLSQYLSGMAGVDEIIHETFIENLFLITGGPMPPNPSELLIKPIMGEFLRDMKTRFDFVILDTPPLALVTDAFVLSKHVDHSIFVVRQNFTPKAAMGSIEDYYETGRLANISILFNDLRKSGLGYGYGHGYGYGYGYGYNYGYGYYYGKRNNGYGYYTDDEK